MDDIHLYKTLPKNKIFKKIQWTSLITYIEQRTTFHILVRSLAGSKSPLQRQLNLLKLTDCTSFGVYIIFPSTHTNFFSFFHSIIGRKAILYAIGMSFWNLRTKKKWELKKKKTQVTENIEFCNFFTLQRKNVTDENRAEGSGKWKMLKFSFDFNKCTLTFDGFPFFVRWWMVFWRW